ncbi:MAG: hydantoinase/oxoprolinase family protein [Desulfobacterales bacterium]|nr:MAG: hydantoinase/oxoprolinase family protein [Desulfobacterales bacterium]
MKAYIDIDTGGTFTDAFLLLDGKVAYAKSPTTPYRLSEGILRAVAAAAEELGLSIDSLLQNMETFRFSTTYATNALIQKIGPKLGLITTEGFEDMLVIGKGSSWADKMTVKEMRNVARVVKPKPLISRDMTVGVKERIDSQGDIIRPLDEEDVIEKVHHLLNKGAEGFVICLLNSHVNPAHEQKIEKLIREEFRGPYLGSGLLIVLSSQVCPKQGEYTRTTTTILNAYLHRPIQLGMMDLVGKVREKRGKGSLMAIHCTGGMAPIPRTTPLQTYSAGPIAGLMAGSHLGKILGCDNVVVGDMGGTSFDLSLVVQGSPRFYEIKPVVEDWWVDMTMLWLRSIGAGGGSIGHLNPLLGNSLQVGPLSAGAVPGPVCYGRGGTEPTVTDADLILGYIDPDYFHGGKMKLDKDLAYDAIKTKIADPLSVDVPEAAKLIKKVVDANMGDIIVKETYLRGFDPKDFVLFAAGGAGPTHCCGFGFYGKLDRIIVFPFSATFCALGSAGMDIVHIYERSRRIILLQPEGKGYFEDYEQFNDVVESLKQQAERDIKGEGFSLEGMILRLELEMKFGGQVHVLRTNSPYLRIEKPEEVKEICQAFFQEFNDFYGSAAMYPEGGVEIRNFILHSILPQHKIELPTYPMGGERVSKSAHRGERKAYWEAFGGYHKTPIFDMTELKPGNLMEGPAIIECKDTNVVLEPGATLVVDKYLNLLIEKMK